MPRPAAIIVRNQSTFGTKTAEEADELHWRNRARDADGEMRTIKSQEPGRGLLRFARPRQDLAQMWLDKARELRRLNAAALTVKEEAAELVPHLPDRACSGSRAVPSDQVPGKPGISRRRRSRQAAGGSCLQCGHRDAAPKVLAAAPHAVSFRLMPKPSDSAPEEPMMTLRHSRVTGRAALGIGICLAGLASGPAVRAKAATVPRRAKGRRSVSPADGCRW